MPTHPLISIPLDVPDVRVLQTELTKDGEHEGGVDARRLSLWERRARWRYFHRHGHAHRLAVAGTPPGTGATGRLPASLLPPPSGPTAGRAVRPRLRSTQLSRAPGGLLSASAAHRAPAPPGRLTGPAGCRRRCNNRGPYPNIQCRVRRAVTWQQRCRGEAVAAPYEHAPQEGRTHEGPVDALRPPIELSPDDSARCFF